MNSENGSVQRVKRRFKACHRCHLQKIKCSGGNPCASCKAAENGGNCHYPPRERKVTVTEDYLRKLEADSEKLSKSKQWTPPVQQAPSLTGEPPSMVSTFGEPGDLEISNPLFDEMNPGYTNPHSLEPGFRGEAACSAFGDRLLQCMDTNYNPSPTSSRSFVKNRTFNRLLSKEYDLPDRIEAKLLIQIASKFVGNDQHLYLRKTFMAEIDAVYQEETQPSIPWLCKFFALLALGEFYSHRKKASESAGVPGTSYYITAISLLQDLYEGATVTQVETMVLLSSFSNGLGRVKTAYTYIGIAMRLSLTLGLHRSVSTRSEIPAVERENRRRIWWTLYHFDRVASSKLGYPITVRDEDIDAEMPSMDGLTPSEMEEFADPSHLVAKVNLAKITGVICKFDWEGLSRLVLNPVVNQIYCLPGRAPGTFVQRVHGILTQLRAWDHELPEDIRVYNDQSHRHVASLHLAYNQLIITTTRPILLHIFKTQFQLDARFSTAHTEGFSTTTLALAEACVNAARTSNSILTRLFIDGSIATFGYLDSHHLFSSTLILIMSAVMSPSVATSEAVQTSSNILKAMRDHGNIPAGDYCERLAQVQSNVSHMRAEAEKDHILDNLATANPGMIPATQGEIENLPGALASDRAPVAGLPSGIATPRQQFLHPNFGPANGTMDALAHPVIEDFLGGNWLAWSNGTFQEDDALRTVALELDDHRLFGSWGNESAYLR